MRRLQPMGEFVVVKVVATEQRTPAGLHLPENQQSNEKIGTVIAVGPEASDLKEGDRIVWEAHYGHTLRVTGDNLWILKAKDIWAIVEDEQ